MPRQHCPIIFSFRKVILLLHLIIIIFYLTRPLRHSRPPPGLERVAEELMGRKKWAIYQDGQNTAIKSHDDQLDSTDLQLESEKNATGASIFYS